MTSRKDPALKPHIPDQCISTPILKRNTLVFNEGMQDQVCQDSKVCRIIWEECE